MRLSAAGARLLDGWLAGEATEESSAARVLRERLLGAGMVHPVVEADERGPAIAFVVPVYDDVDGLNRLLPGQRREFADEPIVVVDDASPRATEIAEVASKTQATLVRHESNRGPAAARNTGWRSLKDTEQVVVFVDADAAPSTGATRLLLAHFAVDPSVAAVAGRVCPEPGRTLLDRYEMTESPLDLGSDPALVRPGARVSYVPTAFIAVDRSALEALEGFDESMRVGEDVDLVWRLLGAGHRVRYEPAARAEHRNRSSIRTLLRQRWSYGSAAAALDRRHPGDVAPVVLPPSAFVAWALVASGQKRLGWLGLGIATADAVRLHQKLAGKVDDSIGETLRLTARGHAHAGEWLARAIWRAWLPLFVAGAPVVQRVRSVVALAGVAPATVSWLTKRPAVDPARYVVLRMVDDAAYCLGVWTGVGRERSFRALLPGLGQRYSAKVTSTSGAPASIASRLS